MQIDWILLEHIAPFFGVLSSLITWFFHCHQKTMKEVRTTTMDIQLSLAAADLPQIKKSIVELQEQTNHHEKEDLQNHMRILSILGKTNGS